ncbi:ABC-2 type transport system permease protein [Anaerosolibacter carboniphilus]|uniref:ABC-2 type transport system permease protein n=1 Tax=Anaerosolibacter carboniphilus TaxID=1417629 RepID=A0A841KWV6_9FIRM|nr:ABC transporter permease subunit [Anaerosolibacter carboniphilus]MBB6215412.1 ABC-2 type transport system permease protein [Anaerosolibacter carboniphilus]
MNIFIREMKANRTSLIIWCIGVFLMIISGMGKYAGLSTTGQSINELLSQMPKSLQAIMGIGTFDLSTASGYYGVLFIYLAVMATIHAAMLGANIISKEERDKTAEFLFAKPISRNRIITSKLLASLINIFIFNLVTLISSIFMVQKYSNGEAIMGDITILMIAMFILQLIFLLIGTAIAAISKNPKTATSLSTGILLITFMLSIAIDLNSRIENLKYLTPFKYYDAKNLMLDGGFDTVYIILSIVIIAALLSGTYLFYKKRDLNV